MTQRIRTGSANGFTGFNKKIACFCGQDFQTPGRLTFGAEYFNKVENNDRWIVSEFENSLAGIFQHEDFMDFYSRKGGRGFLDYALAEVHTLRLEVSRHRYESLRHNTNWSLFGVDKMYPLNPRVFQNRAYNIGEGDELSIKLTGALLAACCKNFRW